MEKMKTRIITLLALTVLAFLPVVTYADTYDAATNQLTITSITLGNTTYTNVVVTVGSLVSVGGSSPSSAATCGGADTYDIATNRLTIICIRLNNTDYTNVVITIGSLVSVGGSHQASGSTACNATATPDGMSYSQSGNTITVTTNGQCIPLQTSGTCFPSSSQTTGINVLITPAILSFKLSGIKFNTGVPTNILDETVSQYGKMSVCIKNAPSGFSDLIINADVCYDLTSLLSSSSLQWLATFITVTNPVTISTQSTTKLSVVSDCATSGASSIYDALTGQTVK